MELETRNWPANLSALWQRRFEFYALSGSPFSRSGRDAYGALSAGDRLELGFNWWAFFFGILYYIFLGITKRGVGLAAISLIFWLILLSVDASTWWMRAHAIATQTVFGGMANYYYFIRITRGRDEWDPLKDVRTV